MDRYALTAELHRRGTNQKQIALRLGVTPQCVNNVFLGLRRNATVEREIARLTNTRVADVRRALRVKPNQWSQSA